MKNILVSPDNLLDFFEDSRSDMRDSMILVAEDEDENTSIYITLDDAYLFYPKLVIEIGDEVDDEQVYFRDEMFLAAYEEAINTYLTTEEDLTMCQTDEDRVKVVDSRFNAYLTELLQNAPEDEGLTNEDFDDLQDLIHRKLFEDYGIEVVYPTPMYTNTGEIIVVQHPYTEEEYEGEE